MTNIKFNYDEKSYRELDSISDLIEFKTLCNDLKSSLNQIMNIQSNQLMNYDKNDRVNFLNKEKTFSFAVLDSKKSNLNGKKYYSISGENMIFRKMIEEDFKYISFELKSLIDPNHSDIIMLKNLISKIKILQETIDYKEKSKIDFSTDLNQFVKIQNEFNDKNLNENFNKFLKNKFDNEIILVNSSDLEEVSLPAIKTAVKVPKEYSEKMKNSNILEKYKEHPFNQNIREETLIQEIYLIENSISKTLENFKSNNNIVESDSRTSDSEHKLLKKFLKDTKDEPDITGNLKIYTSKPACISCISGYQYFKNLRKNITIEVITLSKDLIEDLKVI